MAVPRPVLLAILGLALCVTALIAVRGVGTGEDDAVAPAPIPTAPVDKAEPAQPAEKPSTAESPARKKLSKAQVARLKSEAQVVSVAKALGQDDVVVLFFSRPGAADDTGAEQSVKKLDGMKGVQIFSPNFEDLDAYRPILA